MQLCRNIDTDSYLASFSNFKKFQKSPMFTSKQTQSCGFGNRHCKHSGSGGRPDNAVGFTCEGTFALRKKNRFLEELDPDLAEQGVTAEEWQEVRETLTEAWGAIFKKQFRDAIEELNEKMFAPKNCVAIYAEYGKGQAAMTIYTKEVFDSFPE